MAYASGYLKTSHVGDLALIETKLQWVALAGFALAVAVFPFVATAFALDLANQVFLAAIGAVALMLLTGYAGQVSLGHAGLLAAGAFTTGILFKEFNAPFWVTLPASALVGGVLGVAFGLPSLRLKGLYLAISTLALHFIVIFLGSEYESIRGFSSGVMIDGPTIAGVEIADPRAWYFILLAVDAVVVLFALNILRSRTGRAWRALHHKEVVAQSLGISVHRAKLTAFVISSMMTAVAGSLFAYYHGFVSAEAFSLFVTIQYVAMVIIGGLGSILGALLGAGLVVVLPYLIEGALNTAFGEGSLSSYVFAINFAAFGLIMVLFLVFEPEGLVGFWRRIRDYFLLWPFRQRPLSGGGG